MNYNKPRQLESTKKWHYTSMNDGYVYTVGYCAHDCPGHDTYEEACQHQKEYLLDHQLYEGKAHNQQRKCAVCGKYTDLFVEVGYTRLFFLCEAHRNKEEISKLFKVGESWTS